MELEKSYSILEPKSKFENLTKVTPLSKYLALLIVIILPFFGGYIGYLFSPVKVIEIDKIIEVAGTKEKMETIKSGTVEHTKNDNEEILIPAQYASSSYKVVSVVNIPYESPYDNLVVVTSRDNYGNEYSCGGPNVEKCYFFLESSQYQVESTTFVGTYADEMIKADSLHFISPDEVEFETGFVSDGSGYTSKFVLNIYTGSTTRISHETFDSAN